MNELASQLAARLSARGERLATAESCTGGLVAAACTELPGSSAWFERGLVTYSNDAKQTLLGVPEALIAEHGAVSEAVVRAMAQGLLAHAPVQYTLAVSGVAGPDGGTAAKPVGTVWIAWASAAGLRSQQFLFAGNRHAVREQAVHAALVGALVQIGRAG